MRQTEAAIRIAILLLLLCACLIGGKAFGQNCSIEKITEPDQRTIRWRLYVQEQGQEKHLYAITDKRFDSFKACEKWLREQEKKEKKREAVNAVHSSTK